MKGLCHNAWQCLNVFHKFLLDQVTSVSGSTLGQWLLCLGLYSVPQSIIFHYKILANGLFSKVSSIVPDISDRSHSR